MWTLARIAPAALIAFVALVFAPCAARAERIQVPVPGLVGEWDGAFVGGSHTIEFKLPRIPTEVKWVELRLRGSSFPGAVVCYVWNDIAEADVPETVRIPTNFTAYIPTSAGEWVAYSGPNPVGVFDQTFRFRRNPGSDRDLSWDFLRGGRGEIMLYASMVPTVFGCDPLLPPSKIAIEKAELIVEGKFPKSEPPGR
jgi:hypothetical protein